jgi:DNA repair exonuclease SbcCD ATPase subunit
MLEMIWWSQEETAQLEHALFILEASGAHDRVTTLEERITLLRRNVEEESRRMASAERAVEAAKQIDNSSKSVANQLLAEQFDTVMPLLKELYQRLRPHTDWREIETDFGGKIRASLNFTVGDGRNPQFLFSSGQRRAAGLAFLLAIHLSRPWCRLRSLLLDDPVQHIDDYRALNLVEVLSAIRRMDRQIIIAVEDPALADLLCRRLRSNADEMGRRFDLSFGLDGSAKIEHRTDIQPLPRQVLQLAEAS